MATGPGNGTAAYTANGYVVTVTGSSVFEEFAPAGTVIPEPQVSATATGTVSASARSGTGFGTFCDQQNGSDHTTDLNYQFILLGESNWEILKHQGVPKNSPTLIAQGTTSFSPGPITVGGVCATLSDGSTTRLAMFVDGQMVADTTDVVADLPAGPWWDTGIGVIGTSGGSTTVTASMFVSRYLNL